MAKKLAKRSFLLKLYYSIKIVSFIYAHHLQRRFPLAKAFCMFFEINAICWCIGGM